MHCQIQMQEAVSFSPSIVLCFAPNLSLLCWVAADYFLFRATHVVFEICAFCKNFFYKKNVVNLISLGVLIRPNFFHNFHVLHYYPSNPIPSCHQPYISFNFNGEG